MDIVLDFIRHFKTDRNFVIVDPVMGDYGKLYRTYTKEMCEKMKELVHYADIITPNLTELCTLLDAPYPKNGASIEELKEMCGKLAERGPKHIVVTGIHFNQTQIANFIYNKGEDFQIVMVDRIGGDRSGTGDVIAAIIAGMYLNGHSLYESVKKAADYVSKCIRYCEETKCQATGDSAFEMFMKDFNGGSVMYLYTVTGAVGEEGYLDLAKSGDLTGKNVYVNMTNKCPCSCVFCLRQTKQQQEGNTLWLKEGEPSVETMLELFAQYDLNVINELVFCGFGEPLERLEDVCRVIDSLKETYPNLKVRLNTIGLANLIYGRDVTPELKGRFDTVSISLNAPDEKEFLELTRSKFGIQSYEAIKEFAVLAKQYVPNVVMTVVEKVMPEEKIQKCREICDELGVTLRVRPFEN